MYILVTNNPDSISGLLVTNIYIRKKPNLNKTEPNWTFVMLLGIYIMYVYSNEFVKSHKNSQTAGPITVIFVLKYF